MAYENGKKLAEKSAAYPTTTSSMRMETEAVTAAFTWLVTQPPTDSVILSDSMLRKIEKCMIRTEWVTLLNNAQSITWSYCPGHAGVRGNERADVLAGKAL